MKLQRSVPLKQWKNSVRQKIFFASVQHGFHQHKVTSHGLFQPIDEDLFLIWFDKHFQCLVECESRSSAFHCGISYCCVTITQEAAPVCSLGRYQANTHWKVAAEPRLPAAGHDPPPWGAAHSESKATNRTRPVAGLQLKLLCITPDGSNICVSMIQQGELTTGSASSQLPWSICAKRLSILWVIQDKALCYQLNSMAHAAESSKCWNPWMICVHMNGVDYKLWSGLCFRRRCNQRNCELLLRTGEADVCAADVSQRTWLVLGIKSQNGVWNICVLWHHCLHQSLQFQDQKSERFWKDLHTCTQYRICGILQITSSQGRKQVSDRNAPRCKRFVEREPGVEHQQGPRPGRVAGGQAEVGERPEQQQSSQLRSFRWVSTGTWWRAVFHWKLKRCWTVDRNLQCGLLWAWMSRIVLWNL